MAESSSPKPCPRCGSTSDKFVEIDAGMRLALKNSAEDQALPSQVCPTCFASLTSSVSQGLKLRIERDAREKNKMMAWKNRVHLIKNARGLMAQKAFSEAAVQYEKYLRVLEVVYNLKKGELTPAVFNNSTRSKELTVITSVYWDLVRIYDTSPRYGDRMNQAAGKLAQFLPYSQIYPDIVKKAESFMRSAKNPKVIAQLLRASRAKRGACFVATAAFADDPWAVELAILRLYRDQVLRRHRVGRRLIWAYYRVSPGVAQWISQAPARRKVTRLMLTKLCVRLKKSLNSSERIDVLKS